MIELLRKTNQYKANLHCHTIISDGAWTPEKVKEEYKKHGYSIIAYTDHELFIPHPELTDNDFLALHATEVGLDEYEKSSKTKRVFHMCLIAMDPNNRNHPVWNRQKYYATYFNRDYIPQNQVLDSTPDFYREYSIEGINKMIKAAKDAGFFVTYNHPGWSLESYPEYMGYEGMDAFEIINFGCALDGTDENNEIIYDDMLRGGKRISCIAADDNHDLRPENTANFDSFGAWTMVVADNLDYCTITNALAAGDTYASEGPVIHSISYDQDTQQVHVEFEPCDSIKLTANTRRYRTKYAIDVEGEMNKADFQLYPDDIYFRITLTDKYGKKAFSRAYFLDELLHK